MQGGRTPTGLDAVAWAKEAAERGAGEILLTSMDADGTKAGFDIEVTRSVTSAVSVPVIASGGAGTSQHCIDVVQMADASAVLAASIFHRREIEIADLKAEMDVQGIPVRKVS